MTPNSPSLLIRPRVGGVPADLGAPALPGSKSHAQRALILAGLGTGCTEVHGVPGSDDVDTIARALEALGAQVQRGAAAWQVAATASLREATLECADNGTALRMLAMCVGVLGGRAWLNGSARLRERPLGEVRRALGALGASVSEDWPLMIDARACGRFGTNFIAVSAADTSQAASGALLGAGCRVLRGDVPRAVVALEPPATAAITYLRVTTRMLQAFGVRTETSARADGGATFTLQRDAAESKAVVAIGPDASAFTFVATLARLHRLRPPARPEDDGHPDWAALDELEALTRAPADSTFRVRQLGQAPDSFPALCALAAARPGRSELLGAPALRLKESDRVAAMAAGLRALGVACEERADGLVIQRGLAAQGSELTRGRAPHRVPTVPDHRVVMALALLGTILPGGIVVGHTSAVAKSWPDYFGWLARIADISPAPA